MSAALVLLALLAAPPVRAQFGARAQIAPPIAAGSDVDPTSAATTVELTNRPRALETMDEVMLQVPGARRRRSGGFGGFTALSLRGAEAEHTTVLLGDVPLASADGTAFDLSTVPPWLFERAEVFRGGAPIWLGAGGIGGVLRLVPRAARGTRAEAVAGAGSFDLYQGRAAVGVDVPGGSWMAVAGLTSSGGRFPIEIPDRATGQPVAATQSNAQLLEAAGLMHGRLRAGGGTFAVVGLGLSRLGGIPPPSARWTDGSIARRQQTRLLLAVSGEWLEGGRPASQADLAGWRLQFVVSAGLERRQVSDPLASYGLLGRQTDEHLARLTARAAGTARVLDWLELTAVGMGWHESFAPSDALARLPLEGSRRAGGSAALEARLHGQEGQLRWELRPMGKVELFEARIASIRPDRLGEVTGAGAAMPTARLGAVVEVLPGIALQASGALATRAPSAFELFGDGGALVVGEARLRPETSRTIDGGAVLRGTAGPLQGFAELRGFGLWVDDLIRYTRNPVTGQLAPSNTASAWIAGLEASATVELERWATLAGAFTWIETQDQSPEHLGRALPLRPRTTGYLRPMLHLDRSLGIDRASVYVEVDWSDASFFDAENQVVTPGVARLGAGVSIEAFERRLRVDLTVRDLFDARGRDVLDLPLPGRSVAVQLALRTD